MAETIGIDELHFFPDAVEVVKRWVAVGVEVFATTVATDFEGERMPVLAKLEDAGLEVSEIFSPANCDVCGAPGSALMTARLMPLGTLVVGGKGIYAAACSSCYAKVHVFSSPTVLLANPELFAQYRQYILDAT